MAAVDGDSSPSITTISWQGQAASVVQDSYVVRMPKVTTAETAPAGSSVWANPDVPAGWTSKSLGLGYFRIDTPNAAMSDVLSWSASIGAVEAVPNFVSELQAFNVPSDPFYVQGRLWGLTKIRAEAAWNSNNGSPDMIAAVLDEGIDWNHEDLLQNMWSREQANARLQLAGLPLIPDALAGLYGYDDADDDPDVMPQDPNRVPFLGNAAPLPLTQIHGTHVAGILAAVPNGTGGVGVAPRAQLYSAKIVSDRGYSYSYSDYSHFCEAIDRIVSLKKDYAQNFVVVNASFRFPNADWWDVGCIDELAEAGILLVVAAGNQGYTGFTSTASNVITVGATDINDVPLPYSNAGDIYAPGNNILSTASGYDVDDSTRVPSFNRNEQASDYYTAFGGADFRTGAGRPDPPTGWRDWLQGTSMAAPHVSGAAIIIATEYRNYTKKMPTPSFIKDALLAGADRGSGVPRLNIEQSLQYVRENLPPTISMSTGTAIEGDAGTRDEMPLRLEVTQYDIILKKRLPKATTTNLTVTYRLESYTATLGTDFDYASPTTRTFTIPAGVHTVYFTDRTIPIIAGISRQPVLARIIGDNAAEPNETFKVILQSVSGGDQWIALDTAFCTILNDDPDSLTPAITMSSPSLTVRETSVRPGAVTYYANATIDAGGGRPARRATTFQYTITELPRDPNGNRQLDAAIAGVDFLATTGLITVPAGQTSARIPFRILNDQARETDERFRIVLKEVDAFGLFVPDTGFPRPGVLKKDKLETQVTIRDIAFSTPGDPQPGLLPSLSIASPPQITEGTGRNTSHAFVANLSFAISVPVTFSYSLVGGDRTDPANPAASPGADFVAASSGMITIRPGQRSARIPFTVVADRWGLRTADRPGDTPGLTWDAPVEYLSLSINGPVSNASIGANRIFVTSILDDDPAGVRATLANGAAFATFGQNTSPSSSTSRVRRRA